MTAGHDGNDREHGWPPPSPPPQHPGYGPAPAAPGYGAQPAPPGYGPPPAPPPRPESVRFGIGAFIANLILGLVAAVVTFTTFDTLIDEQLTESGVTADEGTVQLVLTVSAVFGLVFVLLEALFIWWAWQGRNWARIVLFVLGAFAIVGGMSALAQPSTGFLTALSVFQMFLAIVGVALLAGRSAGEWYRAMKEWRSAGLRR